MLQREYLWSILQCLQSSFIKIFVLSIFEWPLYTGVHVLFIDLFCFIDLGNVSFIAFDTLKSSVICKRAFRDKVTSRFGLNIFFFQIDTNR